MNRRLLGLPGKHEPNDIQYFKEANLFQQKTTPEIMQRLQRMKERPSQYFNFGFTINDFRAFVLKALYMRAERRVVEKMFQDYEKKLNNS